MPLKPKTIGKFYWTIGEVAAELEVSATQIRFWERQFGKPSPKRDTKGDRLYTAAEKDVVREVRDLLKRKGHTIEGAKSAMRGKSRVQEVAPELRDKLLDIRNQLVALKASLDPGQQ
ncbi:MAG: MerR family transcriptional regulator [Flavobacteriales bacterium]